MVSHHPEMLVNCRLCFRGPGRQRAAGGSSAPSPPVRHCQARPAGRCLLPPLCNGRSGPGSPRRDQGWGQTWALTTPPPPVSQVSRAHGPLSLSVLICRVGILSLLGLPRPCQGGRSSCPGPWRQMWDQTPGDLVQAAWEGEGRMRGTCLPMSLLLTGDPEREAPGTGKAHWLHSPAMILRHSRFYNSLMHQ